MSSKNLAIRTWRLTERQQCDLELLLSGAFAPLTSFMGEHDYRRVCSDMRLGSGALWPIPIVLNVPRDFADSLKIGETLALESDEGLTLARIHLREIFESDLSLELSNVYGTNDSEHPGVRYLLDENAAICLAGDIEPLARPEHHDFPHLRHTPAELRQLFSQDGWKHIVGFQTRNPIHRAHFELTLRAARESDAKILIHPVIGPTQHGDIDYFTRVRCCEAAMKYYASGAARLSLLPLSMRLAGPREAVLHALIRKNYGCTHFIVGRDHAGPVNERGEPFYGPYDAQALASRFELEMGIKIQKYREMVYLEGEDRFVQDNEFPSDQKALTLSGKEIRNLLSRGESLPSWFTFPEVAEELQRSIPPLHKRGITLFFTGLPASGKSTLAKALSYKLREIDERPVIILDGDIVRKELGSDLGYSKRDRDTNVRRIGFVASQITACGGIAICAQIAPYDEARKAVRQLVEKAGRFLLVHIKTPIEVCESRDKKGLYSRARAGIVTHFTGISDPYEMPTDAELTIDSSGERPEVLANKLIELLRKLNYLKNKD